MICFTLEVLIILAFHISTCCSIYPTKLRGNFSVISASVPNYANNTNFYESKHDRDETGRAWGYLFQLPNTARAWKRINFQTVAILTVDFQRMDKNARNLLAVAEEEMVKVGVITLYFDVPSNLKVRLAQILRLIPSYLNIFHDESFLLTSDADIWPVNSKRYEVPYGKEVHITNANCCSSFQFNGEQYQMFPMTSISAKVKTWREMIGAQKYFNMKNKNKQNYKFSDIREFFKQLSYYSDGENIFSSAKHNGRLWYLDQKYASIKIKEYFKKTSKEGLNLLSRSNCVRLNEWNFKLLQTDSCIDDAHVYKWQPWANVPWKNMKDFRESLFSKATLHQMEIYKENFEKFYQGNEHRVVHIDLMTHWNIMESIKRKKLF